MQKMFEFQEYTVDLHEVRHASCGVALIFQPSRLFL